jgi:hypothetical protein
MSLTGSDGQQAVMAAARERRERADALRLRAVQHVLWFRGDRAYGVQPGGFITRLLAAFSHADSDNFRRLASVYPDYADAWVVSFNDIDVLRTEAKAALA